MLPVVNTGVSGNGDGSFGCLVKRVGTDRVGFVSASHALAIFAVDVDLLANGAVRGSIPSAFAQGAAGMTSFAASLANYDAPFDPHTGMGRNALDAAWAAMDRPSFDRLARAIPLPAAARSADSYEVVHFWGARSGRVKHARIHQLYANALVRYTRWDHALTSYYPVDAALSNLIQCEPLTHEDSSLGGDSGCLLFDSDGNALGFLVGKGLEPDGTVGIYSYFTRIESALSQFGLEVLTSREVQGSRSLVAVI